MTADVELSHEAAALAAAGTVRGEAFVYPDEALAACCDGGVRLPSPARARLATEVIGLAVKLHRINPACTAMARAQLVALAMVLGSTDRELAPAADQVDRASTERVRGSLAARSSTSATPLLEGLASPRGKKSTTRQ